MLAISPLPFVKKSMAKDTIITTRHTHPVRKSSACITSSTPSCERPRGDLAENASAVQICPIYKGTLLSRPGAEKKQHPIHSTMSEGLGNKPTLNQIKTLSLTFFQPISLGRIYPCKSVFLNPVLRNL